MKIIVNGTPLDITLEKETSLGEVLKGIEKWLQEGDLIIGSLGIDGKLLGEEDQLERIPLEEIGTLEITASTRKELIIANMETLQQFLEMLWKLFREYDPSRGEELKTGMPYMLQSLSHSLNERKRYKNNFQGIIGLLAPLDPLMIPEMDEEQKKRYLLGLEYVIGELKDMILEEEDPGKALALFTGRLRSCLDGVAEVSILLQTGKDREGMELIIRFTEHLDKILRLFQQMGIKEDEKIGDNDARFFYNDFNSILEELLEAFDNKDAVLIGDLLEYEVVPRLEALIDFSGKIDEIVIKG